MRFSRFFPLLLAAALNLAAQRSPRPDTPATPGAPPAAAATPFVAPKMEEKSSRTQHSLTVGGQTISYTATTGTTLLKKEDGTATADTARGHQREDQRGRHEDARRPRGESGKQRRRAARAESRLGAASAERAGKVRAIEFNVNRNGHTRTRVIGGNSTSVASANYVKKRFGSGRSNGGSGGEAIQFMIDGDWWTVRLSGSHQALNSWLGSSLWQSGNIVLWRSEKGTTYGPFTSATEI